MDDRRRRTNGQNRPGGSKTGLPAEPRPLTRQSELLQSPLSPCRNMIPIKGKGAGDGGLEEGDGGKG